MDGCGCLKEGVGGCVKTEICGRPHTHTHTHTHTRTHTITTVDTYTVPAYQSQKTITKIIINI